MDINCERCPNCGGKLQTKTYQMKKYDRSAIVSFSLQWQWEKNRYREP